MGESCGLPLFEQDNLILEVTKSEPKVLSFQDNPSLFLCYHSTNTLFSFIQNLAEHRPVWRNCDCAVRVIALNLAREMDHCCDIFMNLRNSKIHRAFEVFTACLKNLSLHFISEKDKIYISTFSIICFMFLKVKPEAFGCPPPPNLSAKEAKQGYEFTPRRLAQISPVSSSGLYTKEKEGILPLSNGVLHKTFPTSDLIVQNAVPSTTQISKDENFAFCASSAAFCTLSSFSFCKVFPNSKSSSFEVVTSSSRFVEPSSGVDCAVYLFRVWHFPLPPVPVVDVVEKPRFRTEREKLVPCDETATFFCVKDKCGLIIPLYPFICRMVNHKQ
ncbi:hypothetical protein GMAR_ORF276 [Golden Marseillevirus]|uniref:hypothetical protein n=1 Tax=Golden Marseillevirus TaxID=1720526 RepID=UPI000877ABDF|nr:hypothetical protein GMAR_ORF276 [Golden Marseillevirus]ALX27650.1 hypothetical protein GMAR_ORF276 [Golden Marseillevirus]